MIADRPITAAGWWTLLEFRGTVAPTQLPELLASPDHEGGARTMKAMDQVTKLGVAKLCEAYDVAAV